MWTRVQGHIGVIVMMPFVPLPKIFLDASILELLLGRLMNRQLASFVLHTMVPSHHCNMLFDGAVF